MPRSRSSATADLSGIDWHTVHQPIDRAFAELQARVAQARPDLRFRRETVRAARFHFNYLAVDPPSGDEPEPLVIGVRFEPLDAGVESLRIIGDISTEESGRILFDHESERQVPQSAREVAAIAAEIARSLADESKLILDYFGKGDTNRPLPASHEPCR